MNRSFVLIAFLLLSVICFAQQPVTISGTPTVSVSGTVTVSVSGTPTVNMTQVNYVNLGSPSNYGTSPVAVSVMGVNAFVTNTVSTSFAPSSSSSVALTRYHASSAAAANIKASAGNLYGLVLGNSGTIPCWLQLFNTSGTPTAGTSVVDSILVQAGVTIVVPAGGLAYQNFATGIGAAGATTDSGATTTGCTATFSVSAYYN